MDEEPRVKGVAFRSIDASFADLRGEDARAQAHALMVPELSELFRLGMVLAASWYPIAWYRDAFRSFREVTGDGPELARQIGQKAAERDMKSVYKTLLARIVSPQTLLSLSGRLFNNYYDAGKFEVLESRRGHCRVRVADCVGWDHNLWTELQGSCEEFLEIARAKDVRVRIVSGGRDGDVTTIFEAHWT